MRFLEAEKKKVPQIYARTFLSNSTHFKIDNRISLNIVQHNYYKYIHIPQCQSHKKGTLKTAIIKLKLKLIIYLIEP